MNQDIKSHRWAARLFGIFIILAFASYGTGSGLVDSIAEGTNGLAGIADGKTTLMIGVVLIATVHTVVTIGLSVLAFPALSTVNGYVARGYLAAGIAATVTAVTDALGTTRSHRFTTVLGLPRHSGSDQPAGAGCAAATCCWA